MRRIPMPHEAEWIIEKIRENGFEAFAVGGCVRDTLLGRTPGDWDITTSAKPEEVKAIFGKTVDTGLQHGTVTIIKNHQGYEVTTYRIDGEYHDGRHPDSVEFTASLTEDLKRRDFTINAMAYSHETGIVDEFGGMEDLEQKIVRCVGLAHDRFTEDALRILRAIRFSAQLGFSIEEKTYKAIGDIAPNLKKVSKERIQVELTKLLLSDHPEQIRLVAETGIAPFVTETFSEAFSRYEGRRCGTEACQATGAVQTPQTAHQSGETFSELSYLEPGKSIRWAGFLRFLPPDGAAKILKGLKLDNETINDGKAMIRTYQMEIPVEKPAVRRILSKITSYQFEGALQLKFMDGEENVKEIRELWREIKADGDCISLAGLAVSGNDLMEAGVKPGKEMGDLLKVLLDMVLEEPSRNEKELLLAEVSARLKVQ